MTGRCHECGEETFWDDALGSSVCTSCGTLADPSQNVLASHLESFNNSGREDPTWTPGNPTLKSLRNNNGWALSGQGKEAQDRQNTFAIHSFIDTLCGRLSNAALSSRAKMIFDQAMTRGHYRWGRKAKLIAGASAAAALREVQKSDSLRDIAILLDESPLSLSRAFNSVVKLLQLDFTPSDPGVHLTLLQTHLLQLITLPTPLSADEGIISLPKTLISVIKPLEPYFAHVMKTAQSLSALVTRLGILTHLPTPSSACAILILAIEGECHSPLPNRGDLAQALGSRFGIGKGVVMQRYRAIHDIIEEWIKEVPWLDDTEVGETTEACGRKRARGKRAVAAKGLKDVIQFQDEIWRKKFTEKDRVAVDLELEELEENSVDSDVADDVDPQMSQTNIVSGTNKWVEVSRDVSPISVAPSCRPCKKQKTKHTRTVENASQFLLNPIAHAFFPKESSDIGLLTHLLTSDLSTLPHAFSHQPTRLQMLAVARAGGEQSITDEELFEEGELESLIRDEEETRIYSEMFNWDGLEEEQERRRNSRREQKARAQNKHELAERGFFGRNQGTKRINMEALKRFMDPESCLDTFADQNNDKEESFCCLTLHDRNFGICGGPGSCVEEDVDAQDWKDLGDEAVADGSMEEVLENWRPMSPLVNFASLEQYDP